MNGSVTAPALWSATESGHYSYTLQCMLNRPNAFVGKLPVGFEYRLLTQTEWENACRAAVTTGSTWDGIPWQKRGTPRFVWAWIVGADTRLEFLDP